MAAGCDVNAVDRSGWTGRDWAEHMEQRRVLSILPVGAVACRPFSTEPPAEAVGPDSMGRGKNARDEELAATRIQARYRGHSYRRLHKFETPRVADDHIESEPEPELEPELEPEPEPRGWAMDAGGSQMITIMVMGQLDEFDDDDDDTGRSRGTLAPNGMTNQWFGGSGWVPVKLDRLHCSASELEDVLLSLLFGVSLAGHSQTRELTQGIDGHPVLNETTGAPGRYNMLYFDPVDGAAMVLQTTLQLEDGQRLFVRLRRRRNRQPEIAALKSELEAARAEVATLTITVENLKDEAALAESEAVELRTTVAELRPRSEVPAGDDAPQLDPRSSYETRPWPRDSKTTQPWQRRGQTPPGVLKMPPTALGYDIEGPERGLDAPASIDGPTAVNQVHLFPPRR
jgi:hypothetical protein